MDYNFLEFEKPLAELEAKINELRIMNKETGCDITQEIKRLEKKSNKLAEEIFSNLTAAQIVQLARHPQRPYFTDYIESIFTDFDQLDGDRHTARGYAIVGGIAKLDTTAVMIIGTQKGRKTEEKLKRNFGMPQPEDYRKALRLMQLAEKFKLPILTFIDTAGAYPGIGAEERNQSEAIARNLFCMSKLKTPIIATILGEGGSGGALALAVGDSLMMLEYSIFSVISPEGCASILWHDVTKAAEAAEALGISTSALTKNNIVDVVVKEPLGGAHRDYKKMSITLKAKLCEQLQKLKNLPTNELLARRYRRLLAFGRVAK